MKSCTNICRLLFRTGCTLVLFTFIHAVITTTCMSPWQAEKEWLANGLHRLVVKLRFLAVGDNERAGMYDHAIDYYLNNMNLKLLSVETNHAEITYTIQQSKLCHTLKRVPVLITIGLVQTNDTNTLLLKGVSEPLSRRLQLVFSEAECSL